MDEAKALALYEEAELLGDCQSMHHLGIVYEFGEFAVEEDLPKALGFYTGAAALGCAFCQDLVDTWPNHVISDNYQSAVGWAML